MPLLQTCLFVDVLNTMSDDALPLTPPEWPEWGNPINSKDDYLTIREYSPYDNVTQQPYPNILATAGLTDPRVTYWEPAKWVAKLRDQKTDNNVLVLKTNMQAGHGGASGRFDYLKEDCADVCFFVKSFCYGQLNATLHILQEGWTIMTCQAFGTMDQKIRSNFSDNKAGRENGCRKLSSSRCRYRLHYCLEA